MLRTGVTAVLVAVVLGVPAIAVPFLPPDRAAVVVEELPVVVEPIDHVLDLPFVL